MLLWLFPKSCVLWISTPVSNDVVFTEDGYPVAWNKDGSELLVQKDEGIFTLNIADQALQPASNLLPDTNKRVYCLDRTDRQELFVLFQGSVYHFTPATGELKFLSRANSCPSASPDGQFVAFEDVAHNLVIIDSDGINKQIIFEGDSTAPAWSPDGQRIAFVMDSLPDPAQAEYDIAVVNVDGSGLTNLTNTPYISEDNPTWSPDGQYLAYLSEEEPIPSLSLRQFGRVYLYNIKDKAVGPLTNLDYSYSNILWSPEGQWIAASRSLTRYHDARMHIDPRDLKREIVLIPVPEDVLKPSTP